MKSWMTRIVQARGDLTVNPGDTGGGGSNIPGGPFGLGLMSPPEPARKRRRRRKRHGNDQAIKPSPLEHPGEPENNEMQPVRRSLG